MRESEGAMFEFLPGTVPGVHQDLVYVMYVSGNRTKEHDYVCEQSMFNVCYLNACVLGNADNTAECF